jgi:putative hydrolase of the HAD superfamily
MGIRAVVFDIGGVLEIAPHTGWDGRWCERLGLSPAEFDQRTDEIWSAGARGEASLAEVHTRLAAALAIDASTVDEMMEEMWASYLGTLNVELVEFVRRLRPRYTTAILSNSFVGAREREQSAYGLTDLVDVIVYSHEVGLGKPDPKVYALTCERLGVPAEDTVFLDDVPACVDGAEAYGMHAILFQDTQQAIASIEARLAV